jgi:hypothetical protein
MVAEYLSETKQDGKITIHSDSQAALMALDKVEVTSKTVLAAMLSLDKLALTNEVELTWVRAHIGTAGNERADILAKEGSEIVPMDPEPIAPVPRCQLERDIEDTVEKRWLERWQAKPEARQSKMFWPRPDRNRTINLLRFTRESFGLTVQMFTGHNHYNRHKFLIKEADSPMCRFCTEAEETSDHLLCYCPRLNEQRFDALGSHQTDPSGISLMPIEVVRHFIQLICQRSQRVD